MEILGTVSKRVSSVMVPMTTRVRVESEACAAWPASLERERGGRFMRDM